MKNISFSANNAILVLGKDADWHWNKETKEEVGKIIKGGKGKNVHEHFLSILYLEIQYIRCTSWEAVRWPKWGYQKFCPIIDLASPVQCTEGALETCSDLVRMIFRRMKWQSDESHGITQLSPLNVIICHNFARKMSPSGKQNEEKYFLVFPAFSD